MEGTSETTGTDDPAANMTFDWDGHRLTCPEPMVDVLWKQHVNRVLVDHQAAHMGELSRPVRDRLHEDLRVTYLKRRTRR